ncbi:YHS domain protein [Streptomyces hoynatensis]|uniref:YHS domain protein n=1 Tax=Streptomyces hoynatensis TaxID=1141874 RepID=A0A3A9YRL6_9ACTN|nr:YHS domain protein [Streptomyces hoynatensis]RKN37916.1 YHS domain protein [Streptomyces hoynatensis]
MMFTEVFVPKGMFTREQLDRLARRLTTHGLHDGPRERGEPGAERADPGVLDFLESITHVVVHEVGTWVAGGRPLGPGQPPRYVVRIHVPGPWRKELSEQLVVRVTRALAEFDGDPERLYREPHAEVHVLGVPEGGYGAFGRVIGESAMSELISAAVRGEGKAPPGMAVDPVCGATVPLAGPAAVTAEVAGTRYGFCCPGCRRTFLARREAAGRP